MSQSNLPTSDSDSTQPRILHEDLPFTSRPPITTEERVAVLSRILVPGDSLYMPEQEKNITALISLYKEGKITVNDEVFVVDGRLASKEECIAAKKPHFWERGTFTQYQLAQKASYGHGPYVHGHELKARIRLPLWAGGDGTCMRINMLNDTGSDRLIIFEHETFILRSTCASYSPTIFLSAFVMANGNEEYLPCFDVEMQMEKEDGTPWGPWFVEPAVQWPYTNGMTRLSGMNMRQQFFMGTSPHNPNFSVATAKGGLPSLL